MQIVGIELKNLIISNENWDNSKEGLHISTPLNDFNDNQISDDSIDLRIADTGFIMNKDYKSINTLSKESFDDHFQEITLTTDGYVLEPGEVLYIGTIERIGLKGPYIGRISGRSTYSRLGLSISSSQDKFCGHNDAIVCLQLRNNSNQGLTIFPHQKLVQIMIYKTIGIPSANGSLYANETTYTLPQIGDKERFQYNEFTADKIAKLSSKKRNLVSRGLDSIKKKKKSSSVLNILIGGVFTTGMAVINFFALDDNTKQSLCIMFCVIYLVLSISVAFLVDTDE